MADDDNTLALEQSDTDQQQLGTDNPAYYPAQIAGVANAMQARMTNPQQAQQLNNIAIQSLQNAAAQTAKQNSPMKKLSNVLMGMGGIAGGIAPNAGGVSSNMPNIFHGLMQHGQQQAQAEDNNVVRQLKLAAQASQMNYDPKQISQLINAYKSGGQLTNQATRNTMQKQRYDQLFQLGQGRLAAANKANDIKQQLANSTTQWNKDRAKMGFDKNNIVSQHYDALNNHMKNMDYLAERLKPYDEAIKAGRLSLDRDVAYQKLNQAYQHEYNNVGMKLMGLNAQLQQRAQSVMIDKKGVAHYKIQDSDANGQPTGQPYEVALPTMQQVTGATGMAPPQKFDGMSDEDVASQILNGSAQQGPAIPPAQQAAPQGMPQQAPPQQPQQAQQQPEQPYTSIGAVPPNVVPQLPTAETMPPPPAPELFRNPPASPAAARRVTAVNKPAQAAPKATAAEGKPQNRGKAESKYYELIGKGVDPKVAYKQAKSEFPY